MPQPTVIVLAGGVSNRFWPLSDKLFVRLGSQNLLERHLYALRKLGCERFVVIARPDNQQEVARLGEGLGADLHVAVQAEPRGMADALLSAKPILEGLGDGPIYVTQAHYVVEQ